MSFGKKLEVISFRKKIILASYNINSINVIFSSSEFFNVLGYDNLWKFFLILTLLNLKNAPPRKIYSDA